MSSLPSIFDVNYESLRDIMIPGNVFIDMVRSIEDVPFFQLKYNANDYDGSLGDSFLECHYFMPYPYRISTIENKSSKSPDVLCHEITTRIGPFIKHSIHSDVIDEIDHDQSIGIIIEISSGYMFTFQYDGLRDVRASALPEALIPIFNSINMAKIICKQEQLEHYSDALNGEAFLSAIYKVDQFRTIYNMYYQNKQYDTYHIGTAYDIATLSLGQYMANADYVMRAIKKKQKIILTI